MDNIDPRLTTCELKYISTFFHEKYKECKQMKRDLHITSTDPCKFIFDASLQYHNAYKYKIDSTSKK